MVLAELKKGFSLKKKVFVLQDYHDPIGMGGTKNVRCESLTFLMHDK
jgi:hypothetical protein